jgi:hypothetical protein
MSVIYLPDMLTVIEDEAFENLGCEANIVPDTVTAIGLKAFMNCTSLKYIRIPAGANIPADAFEGCPDVVIDMR